MALTPAITFQVDLTAPHLVDHLGPNQYQSSPDVGHTDDANFAKTRCVYVTETFNNLKHGDQFTLYGGRAKHLQDEITKGNYPYLKVVSVA